MLPDGIGKIMNMLARGGNKVYIVGGAVRDEFMGKTPFDYDLATDAPPERTAAALKGLRVLPTGLKHGTVTVLCGGVSAEVTTFRKDLDYRDSRRPDRVEFVGGIEEDLARRDFTINAIAKSADGAVIDPYGGARDIADGVIRCVGDPEARFAQDALRIARAVRFAATLGFDIEENTLAAMQKCREKLKLISAERISAELEKAVCGRFFGRALVDYIDIFGVFLPEVAALSGFDQKNPVHGYTILEHTAKACDAISREKTLRLAALFHDVGKPYCFTVDKKGIGHCFGHPEISAGLAKKRLETLRFDRKTVERVSYLVGYHMFDFHAFQTAPERFVADELIEHGDELFFELMQLRTADIAALNHNVEKELAVAAQAARLAGEMIEGGLVFRVRDLAVKGGDLVALGLDKGEKIGEILRVLLKKTARKELENDSAAQLEYVKRVYCNAE